MLTLEEKNKLEEIVENDEILKRVVKHIKSYSNIDQLYYLYRTEVIEEEYQRDRILYAAEDAKKEGRQEGRDEGRQEGLEQGIKDSQIAIAKNLIKKNMSLKEIEEVTEIIFRRNQENFK